MSSESSHSRFDGNWVDCYARKDVLLAFAREHGLQVKKSASRWAILRAIDFAGLEPPRAKLEVVTERYTDMRAHRATDVRAHPIR